MLVPGLNMSRSRRKTPVRAITSSDSEKDDKQLASRRERRRNRHILKATQDQDRLKAKKELSDPWGMAKDGKSRFDPGEYPSWMRK